MAGRVHPFPDEIFAFAIEENEISGVYVCSEHATLARWEGDTERDRDCQRYVDGDIHDSLRRYHDHMIDQKGAEIKRLRAALEQIESGLPTGSTLLYARDPLWRDAYRELQRIARLALKQGDTK